MLVLHSTHVTAIFLKINLTNFALLKKSVGVLYRTLTTSLIINLPNNKNNTLFIIVENMGRLKIGGTEMLDQKVTIYVLYGSEWL